MEFPSRLSRGLGPAAAAYLVGPAGKGGPWRCRGGGAGDHSQPSRGSRVVGYFGWRSLRGGGGHRGCLGSPACMSTCGSLSRGPRAPVPSSTRWRARGGAAPAKLALAGAAVTALLASFTTALVFLDVRTLDQYRFWAVGSLAGREAALASQLLPFPVGGLALVAALSKRLNTLTLGDDVARTLGVGTVLTRLSGASRSTTACLIARIRAGHETSEEHPRHALFKRILALAAPWCAQLQLAPSPTARSVSCHVCGTALRWCARPVTSEIW